MRRFAWVLAVGLGTGLASEGVAADRPRLRGEALLEADRLATLTQQMVDQIFSYAELGFQEHQTSKYLTGLLERTASGSSAEWPACPRPGSRATAPANR